MLQTLRHQSFYESGELSIPELNVWAAWKAHPSSFACQICRCRCPDGSAWLLGGVCFPSAYRTSSDAVGDPASFAFRAIEGCRNEEQGYLRRLNGLFSGILVDGARRSCLDFNDRFGSERLNRHESEEALWLASEARAATALLILTDPNPARAFGTMMRRFVYVVLPSRVMFMKYLLACGRRFDGWTGVAFNQGVALSRSGLGLLCDLGGLSLVWNRQVMRRQPDNALRRYDWCWASREPRPVSKELIRFHQGEQRTRLRALVRFKSLRHGSV